MKKYSVSYARFVNEQASKTGIMFQYSGRTNNPEREIEIYKSSKYTLGIRITDSETKQVVFEDLKPIKGTLIITCKDVDGNEYQTKRKYTDLSEMRKHEHQYRYGNTGYLDVVRVERIIH